MGRLKFLRSSLFLVITLTELLFQAYTKTYWGDTEALKELKNGLDPNSVSQGSCLSSWDFFYDPCDNAFSQQFTCGIRCDTVVSEYSRVTELSLDQAGYDGSLSASSLNLPYLETLDLSGNFLSGNIPDSLGKLTRLRRLGLSTNSFSGPIPSSIGSLSNLAELYIDNNNLEGSIPSSFNGLVSLKRLELQQNKISGEFPDLSSLRNLYFLDASNNAISGDVPSTFPTSLVEISMRNNFLQGSIHESIRKLGLLQVLDLSHNRLTGPVSWALFAHPSLQQLTLSNNQFSSVEGPLNLGLQSELLAVDLSNNELRGFLPAFMAYMPKLSALSLENNKFTGMIPIRYALKTVSPGSGISPFERLLLGGNYLFGPIPDLLRRLNPGTARVSLVGNCLYTCPDMFFFCQGGEQKSLIECRSFNPVIP